MSDINAPDAPERGSCDPHIDEEPSEIPEEVPTQVPVEEPIEVDWPILVPERAYVPLTA